MRISLFCFDCVWCSQKVCVYFSENKGSQNLENISEINPIFLFPRKVGGKDIRLKMWLCFCEWIASNSSAWDGKAGAKPNGKGVTTRTRNKARYVPSDDIFYGQGLVFDFWIYLSLALALAVMEPTWTRSR